MVVALIAFVARLSSATGKLVPGTRRVLFRGVHTLLRFPGRSFIVERIQNTLTFPSLSSTGTESCPAFNVVIAYEDFETGKQAKKTYDYLVEHLGDECAFTNGMWKFDVLAVPKLREMAAKDAAGADIIILSMHGTNDLPRDVKSWIELWLTEKGNAIALVGLFGNVNDARENPTRAYLAEVARRGRMEFFCQPGVWPGEGNEGSLWNGNYRGINSKAFSLLTGVVQQERPSGIGHWGINE